MALAMRYYFFQNLRFFGAVRGIVFFPGQNYVLSPIAGSAGGRTYLS